jgi:hypothetical protein
MKFTHFARVGSVENRDEGVIPRRPGTMVPASHITSSARSPRATKTEFLKKWPWRKKSRRDGDTLALAFGRHRFSVDSAFAKASHFLVFTGMSRNQEPTGIDPYSAVAGPRKVSSRHIALRSAIVPPKIPDKEHISYIYKHYICRNDQVIVLCSFVCYTIDRNRSRSRTSRRVRLFIFD